MMSVVEISCAREARQALAEVSVQGVRCKMPLRDPRVSRALDSYHVPQRDVIGPFAANFQQLEGLRGTIVERLAALQFAAGDRQLRLLVAEEMLRAFRLLSRVLGEDRGFECQARFQRPDSLASRPHYDTATLTLVRTLLGPGTWLCPLRQEKVQVGPPEVVIFKGSSFRHGSGECPRMLHDYPAPDDPQITSKGRIVLVARTESKPSFVLKNEQ